MKLSNEEKFCLSLMQKGCALDASKRATDAATRRACENLVNLGLARKTKPVAWNKSGAYVATKTGKAITL